MNLLLQKDRAQEALEAFRRLIMERDVSLLWKIFTSESERKFLHYRFNMQGLSDFIHKIDEEDIAKAGIQSAIDGGDYAALTDMFGEEAAERVKSDLEARRLEENWRYCTRYQNGTKNSVPIYPMR